MDPRDGPMIILHWWPTEAISGEPRRAKDLPNDPWLYDRLEWLLEHRPKLVERLFLEDKGKLLQLLCEKVKEAWLNEQAREKRGRIRTGPPTNVRGRISPQSENRPRKQPRKNKNKS